MDALIAGDFNIDLLQIHEKIAFGRFFDKITTSSFFPQITLPTRLSSRRGTIIDNILVKLSDNNICTSNSGIISSRISDHFPYFICLDVFNRRHDPVPKYVQVRHQHPDAINNIKIELSEAQLHNQIDPTSETNPNDSYSIINTAITAALENHFPIRTVKYNKHKHKKSPWITYGIIRSIHTRDRLYNQLKQIPHDSEEYDIRLLNLNTYNKILKNNIRVAKKDYYKACFNRYKNDIKNTWVTINDILNRLKTKKCFPDSFNINNENVTEKTTIVNKFNLLFTEIGPKLASQIMPIENCSYKDYLLNPAQCRFSFNLVTEDIVIKIIDSLKPKKSFGHDLLSTYVLKKIKTEVSKAITIVINQSLATGIFPDSLKIAKVVPVHKKDDASLIENYRPISILPTISKIFERVIFNQVYEHFKSNNLLYSSQYGFRNNHSTELAAMELIDRIILDMDKGEIPINVYMDLSKAFDTLDHEILIHKLNFYGIHGLALDLFKSYLKNRYQYVVCDEYKSDLLNIHTGVPQESILGPVLFLIYINDIMFAS